MKKNQNLLLTLLLSALALSSYAQRYTTEIFSYHNIEVDTSVLYGSNYEVTSPFSSDVALKDLKLDVYQPKQSVDTVSERPLMIYLHTGNFISPPLNGSPSGLKTDLTAIEICRQFAKRGYVAASIYYRLNWNPISSDADTRRGTLLRAVFRAIVDAKTAVRFFRDDYANNGNTYAIDPNKVMLFGEGSGGYVSLAYATLDRQAEIELPKFLDVNNEPVVDTNVIGNFEGYGGTENKDNYPGVSSEVQMAVNIGGALADTSWMEAGDAPMVSFHCVRDPFAPYLDGTVVVPTTNENVVDVHGAGVHSVRSFTLGNNAVFADSNLSDPISLLARSRYNQTVAYWDVSRPTISTAGAEGLFPFILPLPASGVQFENQSSPWQFWDPWGELGRTKPLTNPDQTTHEAASVSNPDMSRAKALAYIDTIQWYLQPRAVLTLDLDTTTTFNDPQAGIDDPTTYVGLKEITLKEVSIDLYPNPASEAVVLKLNDAELKMAAYQVYDLNGRVVSEDRIVNPYSVKIDRAGLSKGVYFVKVRYTDNRHSVHKLIFE